MLKVAASFVAAAVVAVAAAAAAAPVPSPAATPFVLGTFQPVPPAGSAAAPLPDIGRTRSVSPGCAAMRDLVIPSFAAALRADKKFAETRKRLPNYAEIADDPMHKDDAFRESILHQLGRDASTLMEEALVLNRALGDPRIAADNKDPQVVAQRRGLQELYVGQVTRANLLNEFVMREQMAVAKRGIDDNSAFTSRNAAGTLAAAPDMPVPSFTAPPNMPVRSGISIADRNSLNDWGASLSVFVRKSENEAAKTFIPIARTCR